VSRRTPASAGNGSGNGARAKQRAKTRHALLEAAREVFNTTPFSHATVADIVTIAGVAHGSFYTHFRSKHDVFLAVVDEVLGESFVRTAIRRDLGPRPKPIEQIEAANRSYFRFWAENAQILASMDQLARTAPEVDERRRESFLAYTHRTAAAIRRWRTEGQCTLDDGDDPDELAYCLGAMVERVAQLVHLFGDTTPSEDDCVAVMTAIWAGALRLQPEADVAAAAPAVPAAPTARTRSTKGARR
jgi:AcrR family transcriptional regulator